MLLRTTVNTSAIRPGSRGAVRELITRKTPTARVSQNNLFARKPSSQNFCNPIPQDLELGQIRFNEFSEENLLGEHESEGAGKEIEIAGTPTSSGVRKSNQVEEGRPENAESPAWSSTFGITPGSLKEWRDARSPEFFNYTKLTMDLRAKKGATNRYKWEKTNYEHGGEIFQERVLVRRQTRTWTDRVLEKAGLDGEKVQAAFNRLNQSVRHLTGIPRKTGSNYVGIKGVDPLLDDAKQAPIDIAWIAGSGGKVAATTATTEGPASLKAGFEGAGEALTYAVAPLAVVDAMGASNDLLKAVSERDKNKAIVLAHHGGYLRFLSKIDANKPHTITSEDVNAFLGFTAAAQKLFKPTRRESRIVAAVKARFARLMVMQPLTVATASGVAIASHVAGSNPVTAVVAAPLTLISAGVEIHEARQTRLRRLEQQRRAEERKDAMNGFVAAMDKGNSEFELLKGIVAGLSAHQDDLIEQAKREKGYAGLQAGKAGATIGGATAFVAAAAVALGGVIAASVLGPVAPFVALPAVAWGGAVLKRGRERASEARRWKWRQRAVVGVALTKDREALEQCVRSNSPIEVSFQEGEYLPKEERFAGKREMKFRANENVFFDLHVLALQVQRMVNSGSTVGKTWTRFLHEGVQIDGLDWFAICQNASFKEGKAQLDYIESQLAITLEIPFRLEGDTQPLPGPSIFIDDFKKRVVERFEPAFLELTAEIQKGIPKDIWRKMPERIQSRVSEETWKKIPKDIRDKINPAVLAKISNEVVFQKRILSKTWEEIPEEVQGKIQEEFLKTVQQEVRESIRDELKKSFPDAAYMDAFDAVIGKFLENTRHLPQTQLTKLLTATVSHPSMQSVEQLSETATPSMEGELSKAEAQAEAQAQAEVQAEAEASESFNLLGDAPELRFPQAPKLPQDGQWESLDDELKALYAPPAINGAEASRDSLSSSPVRQEEPTVPDSAPSVSPEGSELNWLDDELRALEALPLSQGIEQQEKARKAEELDEPIRRLEGSLKASELINQITIRA